MYYNIIHECMKNVLDYFDMNTPNSQDLDKNYELYPYACIQKINNRLFGVWMFFLFENNTLLHSESGVFPRESGKIDRKKIDFMCVNQALTYIKNNFGFVHKNMIRMYSNSEFVVKTINKGTVIPKYNDLIVELYNLLSQIDVNAKNIDYEKNSFTLKYLSSIIQNNIVNLSHNIRSKENKYIDN